MQLYTFGAIVEAKILKNMDKCRETFEIACKKFAKYEYPWIEYFNIER